MQKKNLHEHQVLTLRSTDVEGFVPPGSSEPKGSGSHAESAFRALAIEANLGDVHNNSEYLLAV